MNSYIGGGELLRGVMNVIITAIQTIVAIKEKHIE